MSAAINLVEISCDGPGKGHCPDNACQVQGGFPAAQVREWLSDDGWQVGTTLDDGDRCPKCRKVAAGVESVALAGVR